MTGERVPLFGNDDDLDLAAFRPKPPANAQQVKDVAEHAGFRSREAPVQASAKTSRREPRRHRTGRNIQLNLKVTQEAMDAFYQLADRHGWVLGETFERAVAALASDLEKLSEGD